MSVNIYKPHVLVVPEDSADRDIVNGFLLDSSIKQRNIQVLPPEGGWRKVLDFASDHVEKLRKYQNRHLVLLIDFDGYVEDRQRQFRERIPEDVRDRVFLFGTLSEPESLKSACGISFEDIGKKLASECSDDGDDLWGHELLKHNASERDRLNARVKSILF